LIFYQHQIKGHYRVLPDTYLFAFRNSHGQRFYVDGYAKLLPILNIRDVSSVKAVKSNDHGIFECLTGFMAFDVVPIPSEEVAHAVEFLRHASFIVVREVWVPRKESGNCIQVLS
jgi:hypothetical protein